MIRHTGIAAVAILLTVAPLTAQEVEPLRFTVSTASANVHRTPSTGSPVIGKAPRGDVLEVLRDLGDWFKVTWPDDPNGFGYVHRTAGALNRGPLPAPRRSTLMPAPVSNRTPPSATAPPADSMMPAQAVAVAPVMYVPPPAHLVGLGGRLGGPALGYGISGRIWSRKRIGVQIELSRYAENGVLVTDRMTAVQFAPSVLYSIADRLTDYVWLRPYAGGGGVIHRQTLSGVTPGPSISESTFGWRAFGGTEFTFAALPRMAFSVDGGYDWTDSSFAAFDAGGFTFGVSAHWYFR